MDDDPLGPVVLLTGLSIALAALSVIVLVALAFTRRRLKELRNQTVLLTTVVGTISGSCYRVLDGQVRRIDRNHSVAEWPSNFLELIPHLDADDRAELERALAALSQDGQSFFLRMPCGWRRDPDQPRLLADITGHRVKPAQEADIGAGSKELDGSASVDLVWIADVSDRAAALAESSRMASELRRLKTSLERLPLTIWWRNNDFDVIAGNRPAAEIEPLAALSLPLAQAAASGIFESSRSGIAASLSPSAPPLELHEASLPDGEFFGYAIDRREVESLRAELSRLILGHREVLESVTTAIAIYGPDARLLFFNSAFVELWELDREFLATEPTLITLLDTLRENRTLPEYADYRQFKADQASLFSTITATRRELLHLPDGRTIDCKISRHPFGGLTFVYDDVTSSLDLERSYNTLIEVQRETIDNLFEGIALFGSDGRLTLWNPAFADIWGISPQDLGARPHITALVDKARDLFDPGSNWEAVRARLIVQVTSYAAHTHQLERKDGRVFRVHGVPLPDGNMLMTYQDMTDSYRVQRAMEDRYIALEETAKLKSEFVANVSYELRTPLNAIIGFAEILTNQFFGPLNERQIDYSRGILDGSHRLLALINDVLDLATIESGRMALDISEIDVHALLAGILSLTRGRMAARQLDVGFDCATDIGTIQGDERRLRQVLFNLISNALKFTPESGFVALSAKPVAAGIAITITDSGIGIAQEDHRRIFEKFERGVNRREQAGPGLGLPLVKSFVELHGGTVDLKSEPGQGTAVTCWFPCIHPAPGPEPDKNAETAEIRERQN